MGLSHISPRVLFSFSSRYIHRKYHVLQWKKLEKGQGIYYLLINGPVTEREPYNIAFTHPEKSSRFETRIDQVVPHMNICFIYCSMQEVSLALIRQKQENKNKGKKTPSLCRMKHLTLQIKQHPMTIFQLISSSKCTLTWHNMIGQGSTELFLQQLGGILQQVGDHGLHAHFRM